MLHDQLLTFFANDPDRESCARLSSTRFNAIRSTVSNNHWTATRAETETIRRAQTPGAKCGPSTATSSSSSYTVWREETCWTLCYSAASLVMVLAASRALASAALQFPGHDTRSDIASRPSANLRNELARARRKAQIDGETSVLCIGLLDDTDQARRYNVAYISYAHWFVVVVAVEGVRIYQSWYEQYTLQQWLERGHGRLRSWDEVDQLLQLLDVLNIPQVCSISQLYTVTSCSHNSRMPGRKRSIPPTKHVSMWICLNFEETPEVVLRKMTTWLLQNALIDRTSLSHDWMMSKRAIFRSLNGSAAITSEITTQIVPVLRLQ